MSLSFFYLKYFLYLFIAVAVICITALFSLNGLTVSDMLYPADYAQEQAETVQTKIEEATFVSEDLIPDLCQYAVFDLDGNVIDGNIDKANLKAAWGAVLGKTSDYIGNHYKVTERESEYCVLQYKIAPQYKSATLAFEKIAVAVAEILSRDQEAMYCDCGNIDFIVTYEDGNRVAREFRYRRMNLRLASKSSEKLFL